MFDGSWNALSRFALRNPLRKALHFDLIDVGSLPYSKANYAKKKRISTTSPSKGILDQLAIYKQVVVSIHIGSC